jgi:hypothetical protein
MSSKLPPAFIRSLIEQYNIEEEEFISSHESGEQLTSIRINPFKPSNLFKSEEIISSVKPASANAFTLQWYKFQFLSKVASSIQIFNNL